MSYQTENRHMIDILFVLTLFFVFALSALTLVTLGSNTYQNTVNHMENHFQSRTPYSYITQKIRHADQANGISIGSLESQPALLLHETINDEVFTTYLYEYDGYLCELFTRASQELSPSAGTKIIEVENFSLSKTNSHLLEIAITTKGNEPINFKISTRCGNED